MHNAPEDEAARTGAELTFWCRLFGDMVTFELCSHRRRELDARGGFSCDDCAYAQAGAGGRIS